jgi:DNA-binding transcriptional LysR family regulator
MWGVQMPTLQQLNSFVTVAEAGGFTAAAHRLGLSQPAVSRAVASLEKELGLPLMVRGRDRVSLTDAGALALTHARELVRHLTLMRTEVAALAGKVTGTLSVASLPSVTGTFVAPQLKNFAERHPGVTIRLLEGSAEEVLDWLDQGAAEAGVVVPPVKGLESAALGDGRPRGSLAGRIRRDRLRGVGQSTVRPLDRGVRGCLHACRAA